MITEDYVSFETAKLLKEKGFDEGCSHYYVKEDFLGNTFHGLLFTEEYLHNSEIKYGTYKNCVCTAPTLQMAMKWLREVHNYDISICLDSYVEPYDNQYYIVIRRRKDKYENVSPCEQVYFDTYEEACEAAIKYCLENLI